jgi:hypothetical protein
MDYAFPHGKRLRPVAIDLAALLARIAAQQAATPTAQAYARLRGHALPGTEENPRLSLLSGDLDGSVPHCGTATFASSGATPFSPRKPN